VVNQEVVCTNLIQFEELQVRLLFLPLCIIVLFFRPFCIGVLFRTLKLKLSIMSDSIIIFVDSFPLYI